MAAAVLSAYYNASTWHRLARGGRQLLARHFSASRAAVGVLGLLAALREASTLLGLKALASANDDARPRIYADLRAAAAMGYAFNLSLLESQLGLFGRGGSGTD